MEIYFQNSHEYIYGHEPKEANNLFLFNSPFKQDTDVIIPIIFIIYVYLECIYLWCVGKTVEVSF